MDGCGSDPLYTSPHHHYISQLPLKKAAEQQQAVSQLPLKKAAPSNNCIVGLLHQIDRAATYS